ncbi:MAG: hypothetical protein IPP32_04840 [Bacteroidetes bacterium]|nr:hypothetical protein [Bacteroidota bacterium]
MEEERICPYPGLRPFNDDESIFFRGRERNIETIIELFEKKKFMMLTGASGDGKSSLVYAGVVPQAKAGLFKAKYNSWAVADFRPERTPLDNLARSLNNFFKYESVDELKKELGFGFSSLVNLYKKSQLYIHPEGDAWLQADEAKKKQLKRKAANLLIIADQFEEFFTNSENYNNGMASVESQAVINILLETAKTALAEDLPIYIICTMRSDYIGQCAAFRGLPEYIGFSQFFVPRLKRSEIQQVIEEPAQLNGDSISSRLSQRLLFDITEGYDQLPILQHALNQIWKIAGNGKEEMDLLHYAMVGGLPSSELPKEDKGKFDSWFQQLPVFKKQLFLKPSLENILNAHADELLEIAFSRCKVKNPSIEEKIDSETAKQIIQSTFKCLTKIDDARAVRNRMTLQEISDIINNPAIDVKIVGKVLDIFREQGNTFIKPFITDDPDTLKTHKHTILDITHESLIRNWDILKIWAKEEHDNLLNFQDFNKQLQRWINSDKDAGYLLPIGSLTFFENWYISCNSNKYWLARYNEQDIPFELKLAHAEVLLEQSKEFIKKSARKLFFTRTVIKYGANKLIAYFGLLLLIAACTFYYFDFKRKQNDYVIHDVSEKGLALLHSNQVKEIVKAKFLVNYERLHPGSAEQILNNLKNDTLAFDVANETFLLINNFNISEKNEANPLIKRIVRYMDSVLTKEENKSRIQASKIVSRTNVFLKICTFINYQSASAFIDTVIKGHVEFLEKYIFQTLEHPSTINTEQFNESTELLLTLSNCKPETIEKFLDKLSPFTEKGLKNFNAFYPKSEKIQVVWNGYLSHKGGYQILANFYASLGDYNNLNKCIDSLTKNNSEYKNYWNQSIGNIICYLVKYNQLTDSGFDGFLTNYFNYSGSDKEQFLESFLNNIFYGPLEIDIILNERFPFQINLIPLVTQKCNLDFIWSAVLKNIKNSKETSIDQLNLNLALHYKFLGIVASNYSNDSVKANEYFDTAMNFYTKIKQEFLNEDYNFYQESGQRNKSAEKITNSTAFLYPTVIRKNGYKPLYYIYSATKKTKIFPFFDYLISKNKTSLYKSEDDLKSLETFIYQYANLNKYNNYTYQQPQLNYKYFNTVLNEINKNITADNLINRYFVYLIWIDKAFEEGDTSQAMKIYNESKLADRLSKDFQKQEEPRGEVNTQLVIKLAKNLAIHNQKAASFKITRCLETSWDKRNALIDICFALQESSSAENTFIYLDTLFKEIVQRPKFGMKLFRALGAIGGQPLYNVSMNIYKDIDDKLKPRALNNFIRGIAASGSYYRAYSYIPEYVSRVNELDLYNEILHAEFVRRLTFEKKIMEHYWDFYEMSNYGPYIPQNYEFEVEHFDRFSD